MGTEKKPMRRAGAEPQIEQPRNRRQWLLVTYDIPDDRRRMKVMKLLAGYGKWVQLSVFECEVRPADVTVLLQRLGRIIRKETDDVRIYPLCDACIIKTIMMGTAQLHRHAEYVIV